MIICPNCKEEIEDKSHFCDQCGQELSYCTNCGRVGKGRRCTHCGGLMAKPDELEKNRNSEAAKAASAMNAANMSFNLVTQASVRGPEPDEPNNQSVTRGGLPILILSCSRAICSSRAFMPSLSISLIRVGVSLISIRQTAPSSISVTCSPMSRCLLRLVTS